MPEVRFVISMSQLSDNPGDLCNPFITAFHCSMLVVVKAFVRGIIDAIAFVGCEAVPAGVVATTKASEKRIKNGFTFLEIKGLE